MLENLVHIKSGVKKFKKDDLTTSTADNAAVKKDVGPSAAGPSTDEKSATLV